jgi:hypothetical protein
MRAYSSVAWSGNRKYPPSAEESLSLLRDLASRHRVDKTRVKCLQAFLSLKCPKALGFRLADFVLHFIL